MGLGGPGVGATRVGTVWSTLCRVDLELLFRDFSGGRGIEWLSTYDGSLVADPDVLCLRCWYRAFVLASGSTITERAFSISVRAGLRPLLVSPLATRIERDVARMVASGTLRRSRLSDGGTSERKEL